MGTRKRNKKNNYLMAGFTIVELLIVIIIIGILATIVLNVFTGVQKRARNTFLVTSARAYQKGLAAYYGEHGNYPPVTLPASFFSSTGTQRKVCLGSGYSRTQTQGGVQYEYCYSGVASCFGTNCNTGLPYTMVDTTFNNALKPYVDTKYQYLPGHAEYVNMTIPGIGQIVFAQQGLEFYNNASLVVSGKPTPNYIHYFLEGQNQDCGLSRSIGPVTPGGTTYRFGARNYKTHGDFTECVVGLIEQ